MLDSGPCSSRAMELGVKSPEFFSSLLQGAGGAGRPGGPPPGAVGHVPRLWEMLSWARVNGKRSDANPYFEASGSDLPGGFCLA